MGKLKEISLDEASQSQTEGPCRMFTLDSNGKEVKAWRKRASSLDRF